MLIARWSTEVQAVKTVSVGRLPYKRGVRPHKGKGKRHPYAAIEHRVLDSRAYADLSFSAQSALMVLARQLTADNNGHLQATFAYMRRYGFRSQHTVTNAVRELIAHALICKTRQGGYNAGPSLYAVTWLSVTKKEGLHLDAFQPFGYREWAPEKKTPAKNAGVQMQKLHLTPHA